MNITEAPERLQRKLYDALQLQIHYDRPDHARFRLTLTDDTVDALTQATTGTREASPRNACPCDCHPASTPHLRACPASVRLGISEALRRP